MLSRAESVLSAARAWQHPQKSRENAWGPSSVCNNESRETRASNDKNDPVIQTISWHLSVIYTQDVCVETAFLIVHRCDLTIGQDRFVRSLMDAGIRWEYAGEPAKLEEKKTDDQAS